MKCFLGFFMFLILAGPVARPSWAQNRQPVVNFKVEDKAGREVALTCAEAWKTRGPAILESLVAVPTTLDTITCLVLSSDSFQRNFGATIPDWGVGLAMPGGRLIALNYSRLPAVGRGAPEVFLHEVVHALLFQVAGSIWLPTWFHEGCAMLYSGEWRFADTVSLILDGKIPSLDHLQGQFPGPAHLADRAYRTSLLAVNRLRDEQGDRVVGQLLAATARRGAFSLAFQEVTGSSLGDFMTDFESSMNLKLGWVVLLTRWPSLFVLTGLIFFVGAWRKIHHTRRRLALMQDEDDFSH